ncbi:MAG TPA: RNA polymerase sigma factor [Puia sp.]|nr:RNA polymerase sigma factor [Puia sp.]
MEDFTKIIRGCARNDRASQEKLYKQLYVPLFCMCRRFFRHDHEAIESVNDGMLKVFSSIQTYHESKGKFFNWVYTIVRNTALDKWRAQSSPVFLLEEMDSLENIYENTNGQNPLKYLEGKDLYLLLDQLSPATRVVCNLFYIEGYSIREVAELLGLSEGTVKWQLSEGRKKLRSIFEKHLNGKS